MHVNRGFAFWGVALVTAGVVALAIQSALIPEDAARQAWRLWPVVLIIIGLSVIASRTPFALMATVLAGLVAGGLAGTLVAGFPDGLSFGCGGEPTETAAQDGTFDGSAEVVLDFDCGELAVTTASGSDWSVEARHGGDREPEISSSGNSLRVGADGDGFIPFTQDGRQEWDVVLPTDAALDLTVDANAASSQLSLDDADLSQPRHRRERGRRAHRTGRSDGGKRRDRGKRRLALDRGRCVDEPRWDGRDERRLPRAVRTGRRGGRHHDRG